MTKLKWCIKRTPENYKEVNEWANKTDPTFGNYKYYCYYIHSEPDGIRPNLMAFQIRPDFHEINLDEFRLLTDPEKYCTYSKVTKHINGQTGYITYQEGRMPWGNEISTTPSLIHPPVSEPVFNEIQRMLKERESEKVLRVNETADAVEEVETFKIGGYNCRHLIDWSQVNESNKDFELRKLLNWQYKSQTKLLKKINRKLNRILKRQKEQF